MPVGFNKLYLLPLAAVLAVIVGYYALAGKAPGNESPSAEWQVFGGTEGAEEQPAAAGQAGESPAEQPADIMIYITGAVQAPDVYELPAGSRVKDALDAAGGASEEADLGAVNLSAKVYDEDHIIIPKLGEAVADTVISAAESGQGGGQTAVNINSATSAELETLPGIGPVTAQKIIDYREANGGFKETDDIMNVDRIGQKTFDAIKEYITAD